MNLTLLQAATNPIVKGEKTTFMEIIGDMGTIGIIVMVIIFLLSLIAVFIFFERYFRIKKAASIDPKFMNNIRDYVAHGNIAAAKDLCRRSDTPVARMIEKGIQRIGKPLKDISTSIENVGNLELFKLEKGLSTLATISGAAPMLGFLGTVTGMINAFFQLSVSGNNIDPTLLAGGIYEAMLTTAAGLAVGIVSYIGYNWLVTLVEKVVFKMEASTVEFIDLLQEPAK
ncbi:MAG: MotA/TolQ/ExbB proton channel family protein [Chitinophagales bacterium]|nr:MotA/TolQ/ExbB proton channel family protein [Chitinophagales bacterium]